MNFLKELADAEQIDVGDGYAQKWEALLWCSSLKGRDAYLGFKAMYYLLTMKDINKSNEIYEQRMDLKRRFLRVFKKSSWPEFIELFNKNLDRKAAESDPILMKIYEYFFGIAFFCCKKLDSPDETLQSVL
jgi:hypothetical protein